MIPEMIIYLKKIALFCVYIVIFVSWFKLWVSCLDIDTWLQGTNE